MKKSAMISSGYSLRISFCALTLRYTVKANRSHLRQSGNVISLCLLRYQQFVNSIEILTAIVLDRDTAF